MRQLQLFTSAELARMRDRTKSRNHSPERDKFRREHGRHRQWGLIQRHARKRRQIHGTGEPARTADSRDAVHPADRSAAVRVVDHPVAVRATDHPAASQFPDHPAASQLPDHPAAPQLADHPTPPQLTDHPTRAHPTPAHTTAVDSTHSVAGSRSASRAGGGPERIRSAGARQNAATRSAGGGSSRTGRPPVTSQVDGREVRTRAPRLPTDHPLPGIPPPGQHTRAPRARQLTRHQPPLDRGSIHTYRQHRCLRAPPRGPPEPGQGTREGRCPSKPPHSDDEKQKGQPTRVALEHVLAVNDASRLLRPHPECGRTAITERNQARRPARTDPARHTDRPGTPDKHRPALPIKSAGPSDSADQCRRGIARPIVPRPRHLRGGFAPAASPPSRNGRSAHGKVGLATKAAAGGRIIDPPSRSRVLFSHRPDSTACRNAISPGI